MSLSPRPHSCPLPKHAPRPGRTLSTKGRSSSSRHRKKRGEEGAIRRKQEGGRVGRGRKLRFIGKVDPRMPHCPPPAPFPAVCPPAPPFPVLQLTSAECEPNSGSVKIWCGFPGWGRDGAGDPGQGVAKWGWKGRNVYLHSRAVRATPEGQPPAVNPGRLSQPLG